MLPAVLALAVWLPALVGLGALVRPGSDPELRVPYAGLLGLGVLGSFAVILNFAIPIGPAPSAALWLTGIAGLVWRRRWILEGARAFDLVAALPLVLLVPRLAWPPEWMHYDTGLYHLQTVAWLREHPVQLGLANLHDRLGYDSLWHATAAALELPGAARRSVWFANALPIVLAGSAELIALRRLLGGDRSFSNAFLAGILLLATEALPSFPGLSTDFPAAILAYAALAAWARALEDRAWPGPDAEAGTLLAVFAFQTKIPMGVVFAAGTAMLAWRRRSFGVTRAARLGALAAVALVPWLARNVALSGCAVFPAAATCVSALPWSHGAERTQRVNDRDRAWARKPFAEPKQVLGSLDWLEGWPKLYDSPDHRLLLAVGAVGAILWVLFVRRGSRAFAATLAVAVAGVLGTAFAAPNPRFAYGYLFALAVIPLAGAASELRTPGTTLGRLLLGVALLLGVRDLWLFTGVWQMTQEPAVPCREWPRLTPGDVAPRTTRRGLVVSVPTKPDRCWDAPLPCTPYFDPDLAWRGRMFRREDASGSAASNR